ncbi:hypothetical protein Gogos_010056 [Gossypium gossypioides]|uniref:Uncharacterized protein n=1 Tax=Gossypium gossypioides TaxID=34282 RepID=A0A7J9BJY0_GOSGO|nr:hypothetical protein [Gossypium gossypioides]
MFYRRAFHSQRKGDLLMKDFLMIVKGYCDSLASCGEVISEHEHVTAILNGLSPEYESVITVIIASQLPSSVQNITTLLLDAEARMQSTVVEIPSSANMFCATPQPGSALIALERTQLLLQQLSSQFILFLFSYCIDMNRQIEPETQIEIFYNGLKLHIRNLADVSTNVPLLDCTYNDAVRILERIAQNDYQYPISRAAQVKTTPGVIELDAITALSAQVSSLTNMIKNMQGTSGVALIQVAQLVSVPTFYCEICSDNHSYEDCPQHAENVCYISNIRNNSYGNSYNNSARNQLFWGTQNTGENTATFRYGNTSTQGNYNPRQGNYNQQQYNYNQHT